MGSKTLGGGSTMNEGEGGAACAGGAGGAAQGVAATVCVRVCVCV